MPRNSAELVGQDGNPGLNFAPTGGGYQTVTQDLCFGVSRSDDTSVGAARTSAYATIESRKLRDIGIPFERHVMIW
jgi:hypothetical protein